MKKLNISNVSTNRGFTLIELLIYVVIVGLVASMAIPRFFIAMERWKFKAANRQLISTIRLARSLAISEKAQYGVYFAGTFNNSNQGSELKYILFKDIKDPENFKYDSGDSILKVNIISPDVTFFDNDMDDDVLIFLPNGSAQFSNSGTIMTMAQTEDISSTQTMSVLKSTGRIKVISTTE